jgi:DNA-binding GntR family transcriptional regulator
MYAKHMSAPPAAGPLQIQSVVDQVYAAVRARILSGDLPRGARLRQAALADELGVSRTPLREALRRLATEGLVAFEPNRGATVAEHDFRDQRQSWSARIAIEPGAARIAAERCDADAIGAMRTAIEAQRAAGGDPSQSYDVNRGFHLALVAGAANAYLTRFAEMLWAPQLGVLIYAMQADDPVMVLSWADEHEQIVDAVEAGDADRAERLTREHILAWPPVEHA